jgi:uncharacterized membrane protein (UPF0127 family)
VAGLVVTVSALMLASCSDGGGDSEPSASRSVTSSPRTPIPGFGEIGFSVDGGRAGRLCALLAETAEQRNRGLMGVTDLAGYDGMLFRFQADTAGTFYMLNTPMPLSIAWFDAGGRFVSATDMEPCLGRTDCPTYGSAGPYRFALEVPKGNLAKLGIGPGTQVRFDARCP